MEWGANKGSSRAPQGIPGHVVVAHDDGHCRSGSDALMWRRRSLRFADLL